MSPGHGDTDPGPHSGLGCPFSPPPSAVGGAVHANEVHPVTAQPLPQT